MFSDLQPIDGGGKAIASIDDWKITAADETSALTQIRTRIGQGLGFTVLTMNLDHLSKLRHSQAFRDAYNSADIVTADGAPVAWLARRQEPMIRRTTGADLVLPLAKLAVQDNLSMFLFGATDSVLDRASDVIAKHAGAKAVVAGRLAPGTSFDPTGPEADRAVAAIRASGAKLVIVALGAPKQEIFSSYARTSGVRAGFICAGAALDFLAGSQTRAPKFVRSAGLEWFWRLMSNPLRLAPRYARCGLVLAEILSRLPSRDPLERQRRDDIKRVNAFFR